MAGQRRDLMRRASGLGEAARGGFAQAMEDATLRKAGLIAPCAKLIAEIGRAVAPTTPGG
jgi:hypothetical protein